MSLKNIHVVFIALSAALGLFLGGWCLAQFRSEGGALYLAFAILSIAASIGLVFYATWFLRKMRR